MIIAELLKRIYHKDELIDIWFWRDSKGHEVDLLYELSQSVYITEIKATETIMYNQFKGLLFYENLAKQKTLVKQLVYAGKENQDREIGKIIAWNNEVV
jgi:uncharacterized protein